MFGTCLTVSPIALRRPPWKRFDGRRLATKAWQIQARRPLRADRSPPKQTVPNPFGYYGRISHMLRGSDNRRMRVLHLMNRVEVTSWTSVRAPAVLFIGPSIRFSNEDARNGSSTVISPNHLFRPIVALLSHNMANSFDDHARKCATCSSGPSKVRGHCAPYFGCARRRGADNAFALRSYTFLDYCSFTLKSIRLAFVCVLA